MSKKNPDPPEEDGFEGQEIPPLHKTSPVAAFAFLPDLSFGLRIVLADCLKIEIHWLWGHIYLNKGWLIKSFPLTRQGYAQ